MSKFLKILFFIVGVLMCVSVKAVEIRAIIDDSARVRDVLIEAQAAFQGDYAFNDHIYCDVNSNKSLNEEFFRIREYQITSWKQ